MAPPARAAIGFNIERSADVDLLALSILLASIERAPDTL